MLPTRSLPNSGTAALDPPLSNSRERLRGAPCGQITAESRVGGEVGAS